MCFSEICQILLFLRSKEKSVIAHLISEKSFPMTSQHQDLEYNCKNCECITHHASLIVYYYSSLSDHFSWHHLLIVRKVKIFTGSINYIFDIALVILFGYSLKGFLNGPVFAIEIIVIIGWSGHISSSL